MLHFGGTKMGRITRMTKKGGPSEADEPRGSACGIRTRDLRLERAASLAARRTRQDWGEAADG
jgi:hypothetical protein